MNNEKLLINDLKSNNSEIMSNKQIEEMAKEICCICHAHTNCVNTSPCTMAYIEAEELCKNAGCRKQNEGEWKQAYNNYPRYVCTACNHLFNNKEYKYCPNCGAKMKGE